jgi:hypothetical protein
LVKNRRFYESKTYQEKKCRQIDDNKRGGLLFALEKGSLSFLLTAPYSEEQKQAESKQLKKNNCVCKN